MGQPALTALATHLPRSHLVEEPVQKAFAMSHNLGCRWVVPAD